MTLTVVVGQALRDACLTAPRVAAFLARLRAGEAATRESLNLLTEDDLTSRAQCHTLLGNVAWERFNDARRSKTADPETLNRHLQTAHDSYQTALALLPEDAHDGRAVAHHQLGLIFWAVGATEPAANHYRQSLRHEEASGNPYGVAQTRWNLADLYRTAQRFDLALDYARAARDGFARFDGRAADQVEKTERLIVHINNKDASP